VQVELKIVHMQSGTDIGVGSGTGEGVLDVAEDDIRSSNRTATSLVTSRTGQFNGRTASGIYILRTLVRYVHLPLSTQLREQVEQRCGDFGIARLEGVAAFNS
jgi:hypothetical protein